MDDPVMQSLSKNLWATFEGKTQTYMRLGGHGIAVGMETRTVAEEYYWHGLKRGGDPNFPYVIYQYTLEGHGSYAEQQAQSVVPGMAFTAVVPSDHKYYLPKESKRWTFVWILMWHQFVVGRVRQRKAKLGGVLSAGPESPLTVATVRLFEGCCRNSFADEFSLESALLDWMIEYDRQASGVLYPRSPKQDLLDSTRRFVLKQLERGISVEEIADEHNMSRSHFGHHFKAVTGLSPAEYVTQIRLDEASRRLTETSDKLDRIARETGFADANHFCKVFRRYYYTSPGKFREQLRQAT